MHLEKGFVYPYNPFSYCSKITLKYVATVLLKQVFWLLLVATCNDVNTIILSFETMAMPFKENFSTGNMKMTCLVHL